MTYKFGAHLSKEGDYRKPLASIIQKGGNCLQLFASSPRTWAPAQATEEQIQQFISEKKRLGVDPVYFHASYLLNLADNSRVGEASKKSLIAELSLASKMGIRGSVVHTGSFKGGSFDTVEPAARQVLIDNIKEVLSNTPEDSLFIIENAGTRKIGQTLEEIGSIIKAINNQQSSINNSRIRVCLDTCHLHAAGYDLSSESSINTFLSTFDTAIGLPLLELFHMNDSRDPFSSLRDRHENIGVGNVGQKVFETILNHESLKHLPFIIETPGFDKTGPDQKNLDILKSYLH